MIFAFATKCKLMTNVFEMGFILSEFRILALFPDLILYPNKDSPILISQSMS
jgi:hypothetical protein